MPVTLTDLQAVTPERFEALISGLLDTKGFRNVLPLGGSGDEGIDLRAEWVEDLPSGHTRMTLWAVQCKRYRASMSPSEVQAELNAALEPPQDLLIRRPDFFLIATASRLTPNAHRVVTRANGKPEKYGCHFVLWEGEYIVDAINDRPDLRKKFFAAQSERAAHQLPLTRLQIVCDEMPEHVVLTFMCDADNRSNTVLGRTRLATDEFADLVRMSHRITVQAPVWSDQMGAMLRDTGDRLFQVIPETVRKALRTSSAHVRLTSNVHILSFELAYDAKRADFLGSLHRIGRMHFSDTELARPRAEARPTILLLSPQYKGALALPHAVHESTDLADFLQTLMPASVLSGTEATVSAAARIVSDESHQILHFAGHGASTDSDDLTLVFSDGLIAADALIHGGRDTRLVFLNACASGVTLDGLSRDLTQPLGCVLVGFVGPVTDVAASVIARELYRCLLDGTTLGDASHAARASQRDALPNDYSWASLVIFGDPRFRLRE
jgi:hypothetical protein